MKKNILAVLIMAGAVLAPAMALAETTVEDLDIIEVLYNISNFAYTILLVATVIALTWAGFMYITAQGEPEKLNKAKMMVVYSIIGALLATLSRGIVALIQGIITKK